MSLTGRFTALILLPSAPLRPSALHFRACNPATTCLFVKPAYTMVTTRNIASSVIRLPATSVASIPKSAAIRVAIFPPPCISTLRPRRVANRSRKRLNPSGWSIILPPILITHSLFIAMLIYLVVQWYAHYLAYGAAASISPEHSLQHRLGSPHAVTCFLDDQRLWTVQHLACQFQIAANGQTMHYLGLIGYLQFGVVQHPLFLNG